MSDQRISGSGPETAPRQTPETYARLLESVFSVADANSDNKLSRDEVRAISRDPDMPKPTRDAYDFLWDNYFSFSESFRRSGKVTDFNRNDINRLRGSEDVRAKLQEKQQERNATKTVQRPGDQPMPAPPNEDPAAYAKLLEDHYSGADKNQDEFLSPHEVKAMLRNEDVPIPVQQAFSVLYQNFDTFANLQTALFRDNKIHRTDIEQFKRATADGYKSLWQSIYTSAAKGAREGAEEAAAVGSVRLMDYLGYASPRVAAHTVAGAIGGITAFNRTQHARTVIESMNYFDLKSNQR